jgi:hypothetical protein
MAAQVSILTRRRSVINYFVVKSLEFKGADMTKRLYKVSMKYTDGDYVVVEVFLDSARSIEEQVKMCFQPLDKAYPQIESFEAKLIEL